MKRFKTWISILVFFVSAAIAYAEGPLNQEIPKGMEAVQIGGSGWLIIPKDAKTRKVGAQIIVEGSKEYMSRKFAQMEERFESMEKTQEDLKKEIETLKEIIAGLPKNTGTPPPKE